MVHARTRANQTAAQRMPAAASAAGEKASSGFRGTAPGRRQGERLRRARGGLWVFAIAHARAAERPRAGRPSYSRVLVENEERRDKKEGRCGHVCAMPCLTLLRRAWHRQITIGRNGAEPTQVTARPSESRYGTKSAATPRQPCFADARNPPVRSG